MKIDENSTRQQSINAYNQWCKQWRKHAETHSSFPQYPLSDFQNYGVGKAVLCVANGASLEENIDVIKEMQDNVDILCCDKTLGHLINNGIKPKFCMVCDANVNYELYLKPWEEQLEKTTLFINVCGNTEWTQNGNWEKVYFFVNQDVIQSEKEFMKLSGCSNTIPAGTNVSNAMVVLLTQSDNTGRRNFFGYDKILTIGFDYSWESQGHYYAFNSDGNGKHSYMRHVYMVNHRGNYCFTSTNLLFSAKWLEKYVHTFNLPLVQCTKNTVLTLKNFGDLKEQMSYNYKREDAKTIKRLMRDKVEAEKALGQIQGALMRIGRDHYRSYQRTI